MPSSCPSPTDSFDLVVSRHVLWTLPHPEAAIDEWIRVLRPGGRLAVIDGQFDPGSWPTSERMPGPATNMRRSATGCRFSADGRARKSRRC